MHGKSLTAGFRIMRAAFAEWNPWIFFDGSLYKLGLDRPDFWAAFFGLGVLFVVSLLEQKGSVRPRLARQNLVFRWALYLGLLFSVLILGMYGPGFDPRAFIYAGF
jgi:hypothetical protein